LKAVIQLHRGEVMVDLSRPISLSLPVDFSGGGPRHFGAPAAASQPFVAPGFSGAVTAGASCNCATITLTPHCNGTHTECVGHLTREPLDAHGVIPPGLLPTLLLSIEPVEASMTREGTEPAPRSGDRLITGQAIERGWLLNGEVEFRASEAFEPRALVIRSVAQTSELAPYLTREAAALLVERGIEHLVVDLPSIDRAQDEGRLTAHRIFFGLPSGSHRLAEATRPRSTITELAHIPEGLADGWYLLELQAPALAGDAVPSRPLLYSLQTS